MQEISTATVQPRCGDERDSFQLRVEAVCRPGTLEQWWRWWWLWTRTRRWTSRWRGGWKKDEGVVMHFPIHSGENLSIAHSVTTPAQQLVISGNTWRDIQEEDIQLWVVCLFLLSSSWSEQAQAPTYWKNASHVGSAATLADNLVGWSTTCFHTLARKHLPARNVTTLAQ